MGFEDIFTNKIRLPLARPRLAAKGEHTMVWAGDESGLLTRLEELERKVAVLEAVAGAPGITGQDILPAPEIDAETFYETASDGTLRAGVLVTVSGNQLVEVVMLGSPEGVEI